MAAPPLVTMDNLSGNWVLNKTMTDDLAPGLTLQCIGWATRKVIGFASITLEIKQYIDAPSPRDDVSDNAASAVDKCTHIDIVQCATGLMSTNEHRCVDNTWRCHEDWLYGKVRSRSFWIDDVAALGADVTHGEAETAAYLAQGGWLEDRLLGTYAESLGPAGWTALQVWGFQVVNGERRHVRRVCIRKGEEKSLFTVVYDFLIVDDGSIEVDV